MQMSSYLKHNSTKLLHTHHSQYYTQKLAVSRCKQASCKSTLNQMELNISAQLLKAVFFPGDRDAVRTTLHIGPLLGFSGGAAS